MKISVITINYNNVIGLERTLRSVVTQKGCSIEYIVIDGGSKDSSVDLIKSFENDLCYWISESDRGIYDAMNKGIAKATGDYLLFLNSGDFFCSTNSLLELTQGTSNNEFDIIYGNQICYLENSRESFLQTYPDEINFASFIYCDALPHQATLIKRTLFQTYGSYSEEHLGAEWEFFLLALFKWNCTYKHKDLAVVYYNYEGISARTDSDYYLKKRKEVMEMYFPNFKKLLTDLQKVQHNSHLFSLSKKNRWLKRLGLVRNYNFSTIASQVVNFPNNSALRIDF